MTLVVDASVGLKWALKEWGSEQAAHLLATRNDLAVPDFWLAEAANVLWVRVRRRLITADEAREGFQLLQRAVRPVPTSALRLQGAALDMALLVDHSPYDMLYAAFAIAIGASHIVMADRDFAAALRSHPDPRIAGRPMELLSVEIP